MRAASAGIGNRSLAILLLAVLVVSLGYGVVLPILPLLVERAMGADATPAAVARHTGLLTGAFTLAPLALAPLWGYLSDRLGRRLIIVAGLIGFGITLAASAFPTGLAPAYAGRLLNGAFAAAVTPAALAAIAERAPDEAWRARWFAAVGMVAIVGALVGPMLGGLMYRWSPEGGSLARPFLLPAGLALTAALAVQRFGILHPPEPRASQGRARPCPRAAVPLRRLLLLAAAVAGSIGAFEVGLTLRGRALAMSPYEIGIMFAECSLVMLLAQALLFSGLIRPAASRWAILPALLVTAGGLALLPAVTGVPARLTAIAAVAGGAGVLAPVLGYWISFGAGKAQGVQLGWQSAALSFGQGVGSVGSGLLFGLAGLPGAAFLVAGAALALAAAASLGLARSLAPLAASLEPARGPGTSPAIAPAAYPTIAQDEATPSARQGPTPAPGNPVASRRTTLGALFSAPGKDRHGGSLP